MPIRNFEKELSKRQLIVKYELEVLKKNTIGVDGAWFVRKYTPVLKNKNVLLDGFNREILSYVHALVESMEKADCKMVWVWNGISPRLDARKAPEERRKDAIQTGWKAYRENNLEAAHRAWSVAFDYEEAKAQINSILLKNKIEIINAPYLAAGQGAYMESKSYISMFFGATDYFLFSGGEKLILDFEFLGGEKKKVGKISCAFLSTVCSEFNLTPRELDVLLLLGCEYCPTIPEYSMIFDLNTIITKYRGVPISSALRKSEEYSENSEMANSHASTNMYLAAKCAVEFHPVLNEHSELVFLSTAPAPSDMGIIFGNRVPDIFYFLFSRGSISLEYITALVMGSVNVICNPIVFEALEPIISDIYRNSVVNISGLFPEESVPKYISCRKPKEIEETNDENSEIDDLLQCKLTENTDLPLSLQWLIVMLDRVDSFMLDKLFMFNSADSSTKSAEEIDWEVFECRESFKFAISTIQNKLKLDALEYEEVDPVSLDYTNGLDMEKILILCRKKREHMLNSEQSVLIENNLAYIKKLHKFFTENIRSNRHKRELESLISYVEEKKKEIKKAQDVAA